MAKFEKKLQAHSLRKKGKSIKDIAETLGVAKSTASVWCRDVQLTKKQKETLKNKQLAAGHKGRMIGAEMNRRKKLLNIKKQNHEANQMIGDLTDRDKLMLGIGLYWGEGVKSGTSCVSLVNSDPELVLVMRDWFEQLGVERKDFRPYIYISETHRGREKKIISYWSSFLKLPKDQFLPVIFLKGRPKKIYENHDNYFGILSLRVRKSTDLKYKIFGLIDACKNGGKI